MTARHVVEVGRTRVEVRIGPVEATEGVSLVGELCCAATSDEAVRPATIALDYRRAVGGNPWRAALRATAAPPAQAGALIIRVHGGEEPGLTDEYVPAVLAGLLDAPWIPAATVDVRGTAHPVESSHAAFRAAAVALAPLLWAPDRADVAGIVAAALVQRG